MSEKTRSATLHALGAEIASGVGASVNCKADAGAVYLNVTTFGNSPDTLDVTIEEYDGVTKQWYQIAAFTQVGNTTTSERVALSGFFGNLLRARWTLSGGSPGFTFAVGFAGEEL